MLFIYPHGDGYRNIWMKNMMISLDIIWVASDGYVTKVEHDVPAAKQGASDAFAQTNGYGRYVIEIAAGEAQRNEITAGSFLTLPVGTK